MNMKRNGYVVEDSVASNFVKEQNFYNLDKDFVVGEEDNVIYNIIDAATLNDLKNDESIDSGILVFKDSREDDVFYNDGEYGKLYEWIVKNAKYNIYNDEIIDKIKKQFDDESLLQVVIAANESADDKNIEEKIFALLEEMVE